MTEQWSVLIKANGTPGSDAPSTGSRAAILDRLPGGEKWFQYPPASGRGHGFEVRFWMDGLDAATTAADAYELFESIKRALELDEWRVVRVHVASVAERGAETYTGVDRRLNGHGPAHEWSVMLRAESRRDHGADGAELREICDLLPGTDCDIAGRAGMVEVRCWVEASDAVAAGRKAGDSLLAALATVRPADWSIVRVWATSLDERGREHFLGVERRIREAGGT